MLSSLIILALVATAQFEVTFKELIAKEWEAFKLEHKKGYDSAAGELNRFKTFMENRYQIAKHNQKYEKGIVSYKLGLNKFTDMMPQEFFAVMNGYNRSLLSAKREERLTFMTPANVKIPKSVDWTAQGAVTEIKDQGFCGSCWAFSSTGSLEGQHFRKSGVLVSLSEQNLVDCSLEFGNYGCNGGLMDNSFKYIKQNGGIDTEKSYPYKGIDDQCHFEKSTIGATDKGFVDIPEGNEKKLMEAVATVGPVSVAIDASHESFMFYHKGIYYEPKCDSQLLDHGVLVVGYGTDKNGADYWLVKNSWGTTWGDVGYIKMARNKENHCGIASSASYPLV